MAKGSNIHPVFVKPLSLEEGVVSESLSESGSGLSLGWDLDDAMRILPSRG